MIRRLFSAAGLLAVFLGAPAWAQDSSVAGSVKDLQGGALPGAVVTVMPGARSGVTDGQGAYRIERLRAGTYQVRIDMPGFKPFAQKDVSLTAGQVVKIDASLEISLVESVTVTAQRREEDLQQVPLSITALTSLSLERSGVQDLSRVQYVAPSLNVGRAGEDVRPAMRGARTEQVGAVNDPVVGFHVDGVYKPRPSQATNAFVDVERVEVQRGPQGTLFGRNTFGGNIAIVTKTAENRKDAALNVTLGDYKRGKADGYFNVPLSDRVFFRVAGNIEKRDGYIKNNGTGGDLWDEDIKYVRGTLRFLPSDKVDVVARFTHWDQGGAGQGDFAYSALGTLRLPNGQISLLGNFDPVSTRRGSKGAPRDTPYSISRDAPFKRDNKEDVGTLQLTWTPGSVSVKSITAYSDFHSYRANDADFSANAHSVEDVDEFLTSLTQEVQISSNQSSRFKWLVGGFSSKDDLDYTFFFDRVYQDLDDDGNPTTASAATRILSPGTDFVGQEFLKTTSNAVFGQASWDATDKLRFVAGARYTRDEKTYSSLNPETKVYAVAQGVTVRDLKRDWTKATWKAGLDYKVSANTFLFGSVSTGFVAGGFATAAPTFKYDPQEVTAYEAGLKTTLGGKTQLNASTFFNDYTGMLANAFVTGSGGAVLTYQTNAGAIKAKGVEVELTTTPVANLNLRASVALMDAKYGDFILPNPFPRGGNVSRGTGTGNFQQVDGTQVALNPDFRGAFGVSYDIKGSAGTFTPSVQLYASSSYSAWDIIFGPDAPNVQKSYTKTDARLSFVHKGGKFTASAFAENLENKAVLLRALRGGDDFIQGSYAAPRIFGVRLGYHF